MEVPCGAAYVEVAGNYALLASSHICIYIYIIMSYYIVLHYSILYIYICRRPVQWVHKPQALPVLAKALSIAWCCMDSDLWADES